MAVAKRQGREKPAKIEQRKVPGGPQVEQTTLLAGPIYIGQPQGEGKKLTKKRSQSLLSLPRPGVITLRIWVDMPLRLEDGFSCYHLNKIEL